MSNSEVKQCDNKVEYYDKEGQLHNDNGPAVIYANGDKVYYKHGLIHREDGAAFEGQNGYKAFWLNGVKYRRLNEYKIATINNEHYIAIVK
jgi:hypothetical protein